MFRSIWVLGVCVTISGGFVGSGWAAAVKIQPDESASQDTFIYEYFQSASAADIYESIAPGNGEALASLILATTRSATGHTMHSLVRFDLTGVSLGPGEKAVLGLYVRPSAFGSAAPSSSYPAPLSVYAASTPWTESVTWQTQPLPLGSAVDSIQVTGTNQFIEFDVTAQVQAWLAGSDNNGFIIQQDTVVVDPNGRGPGIPGEVGVFFRGAGWSDPSQRPYLQVIPEPTGLVAGLTGFVVWMARRRRITP